MSDFKSKLNRLYKKAVGRFGKGQHTENEYKKMIRFGALSQMGENYYLYIYRDIYRSAGYYGAVIFLDKFDEFGNPVRVICLEQDGVEQTRNIYIRAALYFLKEEYDNTMDVAGKIAEVFQLAQTKINDHIDQSSSHDSKLENFDFDVSQQDVVFKKIELKKFTCQIETKSLREQIQILSTKEPDAGDTNTRTKNKDEPGTQPARLGLKLKLEQVGLTGDKRMVVEPTALPIAKNGRLGKPRKLSPNDQNKYRFLQMSPLRETFVNHFFSLKAPEFGDALRNKILNTLYFRQLAGELLTLPEELRSCQVPSAGKTFAPLQPLVFDKITVHFAPCLKKETVFRIRLSLSPAHASQNEIPDREVQALHEAHHEAGRELHNSELPPPTPGRESGKTTPDHLW
ncbi:MAG: hypothetical protein GY765_09845, partial [bacterium]|nr:hypothetical protein [bacterium]